MLSLDVLPLMGGDVPLWLSGMLAGGLARAIVDWINRPRWRRYHVEAVYLDGPRPEYRAFTANLKGPLTEARVAELRSRLREMRNAERLPRLLCIVELEGKDQR